MAVEELCARGIQLYNEDDKAQAHRYFKNVIKKLELENKQATLNSEKRGVLSEAMRHYGYTSLHLGKINCQALMAEKINRQKDSNGLVHVNKNDNFFTIVPLIAKQIEECPNDLQRYNKGIEWRNQGNKMGTDPVQARFFWTFAMEYFKKINLKNVTDESPQNEKEFYAKVIHNKGSIFHKFKRYQKAFQAFTLAARLGNKISKKAVQQMIKDGLVQENT